jgi:GT2 family glycosyltransferase
MYTGHSLRQNMNNIDVLFDDVKIKDFNRCEQIRSCIWSRNAIENTPGYFSNLSNNTEIFVDYVLKTLTFVEPDRIRYNNVLNMEYVEIGESSERVKRFYQNTGIGKPLFLYYSKTPYTLLFQRPQQITRFMDNDYTKVFICKEENMLEYEEKYNLFVISYEYKKIVLDILKSCDTVIYYTDNRLLDEILSIKGYGTIKLMYDLIDNPSEEFSVWKPNLEKAIHKSDFVTYSHPKLLNTLLEVYADKKYYYISNACDYEHFSKAKERIGKRPVEYGKTTKKILGYYGAFAEWLDYDLIREYANKGEYHIIMIGGIANCASYNIRFEHPNITWLNHKSYDELPYYLSWFDVCFLPFRDCDFIKYVNPCKLWEYMASGKQIIKTGIDIECDKLITYKDVCETIYNVITPGACDKRVINGIMNYNVKNEMDYENNSILFNSINDAVSNKSNKTLNYSKPVIIVFSMIDYFFRIQRTQHLAHLCANNGYTVFYLTTRINVDSDHNWATEIVPNLYEINLACPTNRKLSVYGSVLTNNEVSLLVDSINNIRRRYNFQHFISFIANPFWLQVTRKVNNTSIIYDCLDNTKEFKTHGDYILSLEHEAITSEYVTYTTPILKEVMDCKSNSYSIIRNGTEFDYFNSIETVKLKRKARPIVGYYGAISDWWDVELVENMIRSFPKVDFHFIGNIAGNDETYLARIRNLSNYSNVTFFGEVPYDKLADYLKRFNVGIIPFVLNDLIKCTNPVKMYEMFSFGIPVVMTELLDVVQLNVDDICYISKSKEDFIQNIQTALNENDAVKKEKRIEYARNNSWHSRFLQFEEIITKLMPAVSIVLLCYNNWNVTKRCIESVIQNSNYPYYEIIVVNNNSQDQTRRELNKLYKDIDNIKIVHNKANYGFATGMNVGALYAKYDYIVLLNNDTVVNKDWLYPLVKPLILKEYSMASPITNNCGNGVKQFIHFKDLDDLMMKASKLQKMNNYKICEIDRIPFFCPILRKEDFYRVGLLDINYKVGGWEDDDIIHKIKLYNGRQNCYTFGSFVYHMESLTMSQMHNNNSNWSAQTRNKDYYESKWNTRWLSNTYKIPVLNNTMMSWRVCDFFMGILTRAKQSLGTHIDYVDNKMNIIIKDTGEDSIEFNEIYIKNMGNSNILLKNKYESIQINCGDLSWSESIRFLSFINTSLIMTEP